MSAEAYREAGATTFIAEIHPTSDGYNVAVLNEMLAWRDTQQ